MYTFIRMNKASHTYQQVRPGRIAARYLAVGKNRERWWQQPFYRIKKGAATTLWNVLFIVVPVGKVVAVAALL